MKKALIVLALIPALLLTALAILPLFLKSNILGIIQRQSSRYVKAELKIGDMDLSMFRHFPHLNIALKNVSLTGEKEFAGDTLLDIPLLEASVNVKSLISGNEITVNRILLKDCRLQADVDTAGRAAWTVFPDLPDAGATAASPASAHDGEKDIRLNGIDIENLYLSYNNYHTSTYASIGRITLRLSGNDTALQLALALNDISCRHRNSVWVDKTNVTWNAALAADFRDRIFEIRQNDLSVNDLKLNLTGKIAAVDDRYRVSLQLNAPDTKFESLLALAPETFRHYTEGLQTGGDFNLEVRAEGDCYENHLPAFRARLAVRDASIQYPDLPESVRNINIDLNIGNPGGPSDSTRIRLNRMAFDLAGNPFELFLTLDNPHDPLLDGGAAGTIDFSDLKKALPLKDISLQGRMTSDITFKGKYRYIEEEQYEKFTAKGNILLRDILLVNRNFPRGISIPQGSVAVTPACLHLDRLQAKVRSSDFLLRGKLSNYLPYLFGKGILKGDFSLTSSNLNLNEFVSAARHKTARTDTLSPDGQAETARPSAAEGVLEIPANIDIRFSTDIRNILFDRLTVRNAKGDVRLSGAVAELKNLEMSLLNGNMVMNGQYNTVNPKTPKADFSLKIADFDIREACRAFTFVRKSVPVAANCEGRVSAAMKFSAALDRQMSPVMSTANGGGSLESPGILVRDNPAMKQLADILKNEELGRLSISRLKIDFSLENGNITVAPFRTAFAGNPVSIYGGQSADGRLDYTLSMTVDRKFFGRDIDRLLKSIPGSDNIRSLDLDAKVGGTLEKPVIKPDLTKAIKAVSKEAEKSLKGNVLQGLRQLFRKK